MKEPNNLTIMSTLKCNWPSIQRSESRLGLDYPFNSTTSQMPSCTPIPTCNYSSCQGYSGMQMAQSFWGDLEICKEKAMRADFFVLPSSVTNRYKQGCLYMRSNNTLKYTEPLRLRTVTHLVYSKLEMTSVPHKCLQGIARL